MSDKLSPFDFLNAINMSKSQLIVDDQTEKQYNAFMVNRGLSYFRDTVLLANEMNSKPYLDKKLQFSFYLNSVAPRKRFSKWHKAENPDDLEVVKEYYGYSNAKAKQVLDILTSEQIDELKQRVFKGGSNVKPART